MLPRDSFTTCWPRTIAKNVAGSTKMQRKNCNRGELVIYAPRKSHSSSNRQLIVEPVD